MTDIIASPAVKEAVKVVMEQQERLGDERVDEIHGSREDVRGGEHVPRRRERERSGEDGEGLERAALDDLLHEDDDGDDRSARASGSAL